MNDRATLADLLSEARIKMKRQAAGSTESSLACPQCEGGTKREKSLSCTIDDDGRGIHWQCYRGTCGYKGGLRCRDERRDEPRRPPHAKERQVAPPPAVAPKDQAKPEALYAFFEKRGIERDVVDEFGIYIAPRWFPEGHYGPAKDYPSIVFPYTVGGKVVNRKYRPPFKNPQMQEKDALPSLYNIDSVESDDILIWVEGEPDVLALRQAGYKQIVSLPNGAPAKLNDHFDPENDTDARFAPLRTHADKLAGMKKVVLAGDNDAPGLVLREELARRLGRHRCWVVTWPEGCKDANDTLIQHGKDAVILAVEGAEAFPIEGVQRLQGDTLLNLRKQPPPPVLMTGIDELDSIVRWPGEGRLIVITGIPGMGKSSVLRQVKVALMERHGRRWAVFTPEMQPWETYAASCAEMIVGKPFWRTKRNEAAGILAMSDEEMVETERWLKPRVSFLVSDAEDSPPTLDWLLERAKACVLRDGTTDLLIDPWNEVEHQRGPMSETEYIGRSLQRLKAFAYRHGCNVWIIAHPVKLQPAKPGASIEPPGLYDINGGANWANKTDLGICVHLVGTETQVHIRKSRFARFGRRGGVAKLAYDPVTHRFTSANIAPPQGSSDDDIPI